MDINLEILRIYLEQRDIGMTDDMQKKSKKLLLNTKYCLKRVVIGNARISTRYLKLFIS
jgi:hypothetical protein